jgi:type I restriction enzyme S subunit
MNAEILLQHFKRISEAPDAILRLRRFILDLAVRGKLVEQDPNDEPAAELLKRIQAEKQMLIKEGKIKKPKPLPSIKPDELPYELPQRWEWVRLGAIGTIGSSSRVHQKDWTNRGVPFYRAREIVKLSKNGFVNNELFITEELFRALSSKGLTPEAGDIMITGVGTIGVPYVVSDNDRFYFKDASVLIFKNQFNIYPIFLCRFFESPHWVECIHKDSMGTTVHTLTIVRASEVLTPLPPVAEQHRIVAKVDELMALCDQLEAARAEREQSRDRLLAANLHNLNKPADDEEAFREHARFTFNHLPHITTRPAHIKQLRQTILNLAVRGKLVTQNPNDEPAAELLKRIQAEKARLEKEGKTKREKLVDAIDDDKAPFAIPETWNWARLGDLAELITKGSSPKWQGIAYVSMDDGILFITSENVGNYHLRKLDELKYVEKRFNEIEPRSMLRSGDILMNLVGASIGRTAIYDLSDVANINQAVALIRLIQSTANLQPEFMLHYLNSPSSIQLMMDSQVVAAQPNISLTNAREFPIPVPPLAEQSRIVAKVDELMALCDQLEDQLNTTQTESRRLLEAVLHEALAPALE